SRGAERPRDMKMTMMFLVSAAAAGAIGAWAMRPKCATVAAPARVTQVAAVNVPVPSVIESFPMPATSAPRRDVFAFGGAVSRPPVERRIAVAIAPPVETPQAVVTPPPKQEEPAY